jgi:hypothetical protein
MWDSSINPASGLPGRADLVASTVENTASGPVLVLRPDPKFFTGDVTYPIVVDPTATLTVSTDTWLETPNYTTPSAVPASCGWARTTAARTVPART